MRAPRAGRPIAQPVGGVFDPEATRHGGNGSEWQSPSASETPPTSSHTLMNRDATPRGGDCSYPASIRPIRENPRPIRLPPPAPSRGQKSLLIILPPRRYSRWLATIASRCSPIASPLFDNSLPVPHLPLAVREAFCRDFCRPRARRKSLLSNNLRIVSPKTKFATQLPSAPSRPIELAQNHSCPPLPPVDFTGIISRIDSSNATGTADHSPLGEGV